VAFRLQIEARTEAPSARLSPVPDSGTLFAEVGVQRLSQDKGSVDESGRP
jgi:hypothetical protein